MHTLGNFTLLLCFTILTRDKRSLDANAVKGCCGLVDNLAVYTIEWFDLRLKHKHL